MNSLEARQRRHVFYTWTAQNAARPVSITGGEGAWFFAEDGERWLDFESQVFNANLGHGETRIIDAIKRQADTLACAHPAAVYETKAALGEALATVTPGNLNKFFLCLSGAEAVENAFKIARMVTGRPKVIARRRSYHGASAGALSLTGDPRRWAGEPGLWGVARIEDPYCYRCPFGKKPDSCSRECAMHLEHVLQMEGPDRVAAVFLEGITGANGGFVPPDDYWPRMREICDRHGVLLISDEVFSGFGRAGEWFAVDRYGVVPDLITMAKGLTGGYAPLGAVALSDNLAAHFDENPLWAGLTAYAHPISCAAALAAIEVFKADDLIARSRALETPLLSGLRDLQARHEIVGDARAIGLFGTLEFAQPDGSPCVPYAQAAAPGTPLAKLKAGLAARNVHALLKGNFLFITPPVCISEADLAEGLSRIDDAITEACR